MQPRPGVVDVIRFAQSKQLTLGLVTTTSRENVDALLGSIALSVPANTFSVIIDATQVENNKPNAECYRLALRSIDASADDCVVIEDNVDGLVAARSAGIRCIAFPGANTADHDYSAADSVTADLLPAVSAMLQASTAAQ